MLMAIAAVLAALEPAAVAATSCVASDPFSPVTLAAGEVIVTDITANAVYRVTADGSTCTIVSSGGFLDSPRAVVVGPSGLIFVTDSANADAVIRIDPALPPTANQVIVTRQGVFSNPRGIAIDSIGDFLVAEPENDRIYRVNPASGSQSIFSAAGWGEETFQFPSDIALDATGRLLVTDAPSTLITVAKRLLRVAATGGLPFVLAKDDKLKFPRGVAVEANGDAVVADSGTAGPPASPPSLIRVSSAGVQSCVPQSCLGVTGGLLGPRGVAVESSGNLVVADFTAREVYRVHPDGPLAGQRDTLLSNLSFGPWGIAVVGTVTPFSPSKLLVADAGAGTVVKITPASGATPVAMTPLADPEDELSGPVAVTRTPGGGPWQGKLLVADGGAVYSIDDAPGVPANLQVVRIAANGSLANVTGIAVDFAGDVLVTDATANAVVRIKPNGAQFPVRCAPPAGSQGAVDLTNPRALAIDRDGLLVVATGFVDTAGARARILRMNPGTGVASDDNPGVACRLITEDRKLHDVRALAIDPSGDVLIADDVPPEQTTGSVVDSVWRLDAYFEDLSFVMSLPAGVPGSFRGVVADANRDVIVANVPTPEATQPLPELLRIDPLLNDVQPQIASGPPLAQLRGIALDAAPTAFMVKDPDGDLVGDSVDNCKAAAFPNADQVDSDFDTVGDVCDTDDDNDGVDDATDNCPIRFNPADAITLLQLDTDSDGLGDVCDNCPADANPDQKNSELIPDGLGDVCDPDDDNDADLDAADNCQFLANSTQIDTNQDGYGNACDADYNNDGMVGLADFGTFKGAFGKSPPDPAYNADVDADGDGGIGISEFGFFKRSFGAPPGPSGLACAGTIPCLVP